MTGSRMTWHMRSGERAREEVVGIPLQDDATDSQPVTDFETQSRPQTQTSHHDCSILST